MMGIEGEMSQWLCRLSLAVFLSPCLHIIHHQTPPFSVSLHFNFNNFYFCFGRDEAKPTKKETKSSREGLFSCLLSLLTRVFFRRIT